MCTECDKVYNGTVFISYERAMQIYHNTMMNNTDVCKVKKCGLPLIPFLQDLNKK